MKYDQMLYSYLKIFAVSQTKFRGVYTFESHLKLAHNEKSDVGNFDTFV